MLHGVYGAAVTMDGAARQHEQIAKNLAHAQVPGYRRVQLTQGTFDDSLYETTMDLAARSSTGTRGLEESHDFTTGLLQQTGRPFDIALKSDGFFVVGEREDPLYTRNGSFTIDAQGKLITQDGRTVQGTNGPISVPVNGVAEDVVVDQTGRVSLDQIEIGRIKVVHFQDTGKLFNVGTTLFRDPELTVVDEPNARMQQGALEKSNVHPVRELVELIAVQRRYDAASRTLRTLMRTVEQRINLQRGN